MLVCVCNIETTFMMLFEYLLLHSNKFYIDITTSKSLMLPTFVLFVSVMQCFNGAYFFITFLFLLLATASAAAGFAAYMVPLISVSIYRRNHTNFTLTLRFHV